MMSERSGVGDDGGVDEPAKRHKQRRHRKHKRGSSRRRDSDQRGANGGDTAHSASNQVAQHVVRDTPRASVTAPGLAPPPPPHVDVTGATGTRQGIVVVVVLVCVTALGVASWTMKGSRVAMVAVEGHAGVGHSGGVPAHKLSPDTVAGQWNQHEHKWRPLPNPAVDCPGPVRKRYGTVDEDEWLGVIGTLMAENPGIARFYSQVPASSRVCVRVAGASAHIACAPWLPPPPSWQDGEDMYLMHRFFGRPVADGGVFIDVGAMDGKTHSNTAALEEAMDWAGICIEPSPPNFVQLKRKRPYCDSYNVAICKEPGRTVVYGEVRPRQSARRARVLPSASDGCTTAPLPHASRGLAQVKSRTPACEGRCTARGTASRAGRCPRSRRRWAWITLTCSASTQVAARQS